MTGKFIPRVNDCSIFKEISLNTVNPLEIIREQIQNSDDSKANEIEIIIDRDIQGRFVLIFEDNGEGMQLQDIYNFFNLGFSNKDNTKIGEKGLGTKIFYKSDEIYLETTNNSNVKYIAKMNNPWNLLKENKMPLFDIKELKGNDKTGTKVIITGYKVDSPERFFNIDTITDYVQWFTAGGSFRNIFCGNLKVKNMINNIDIVPKITIIDKINNKSKTIAGIHQFEYPNENPDENMKEAVYKKSNNYARHFGPFHLETNINGEYVSVQIYGTISGRNCKREICKFKQGYNIKSRFGLYLAKDFIPCIKMNSLIHTEKFYHYHILANSQNFTLTSDRNNISNLDDIKIKWVINQIESVVNKQIAPIAERDYFSMRKQEEHDYELRVKCEKIKKNLNKIIRLEDLVLSEIPISKEPSSELETAMLMVAILSNPDTKKYINRIDNIVSYSSNSPTDMICRDGKENMLLVEVEYKLSSFFYHNHPIDTVDIIMCWVIDIDEYYPYNLNNERSTLIRELESTYLVTERKKIEVIELKNIVKKINKNKNLLS